MPAKKTTTSKQLVKKEETPLVKASRAVSEFLPYVNITKDFALIPNAGGKLVEPTRDLAMKLIAYFDLSYDTELISKEDKKLKNSKGQTMTGVMYTMKATVSTREGVSSSGHGMASTLESHTVGREDHDAMARAETRALKRAIEGRVGLPMINQIILKMFGGFTIGPNKERELGLR